MHSWRSSKLRKAGKLDYPSTIISTPSFKSLLDLGGEILKQCPRIAVLRRIDLPESEAFNNLGKLKDTAIDRFFTPSKIPNMSLNLLGAHFRPSYIQYIPKGPAAKEWDGNEHVFLLDFIKSVEVLKETNYCPLYFWAKDIHDCKFPATTVVNRDTKRILENLKLDAPLPNAVSADIPCRTELIHFPTRLNYWHVHFTLIGADQPIKQAGSGYQRNAAEYAITHILSVKGKKIISDYEIIPLAFYRKKRWFE